MELLYTAFLPHPLANGEERMNMPIGPVAECAAVFGFIPDDDQGLPPSLYWAEFVIIGTFCFNLMVSPRSVLSLLSSASQGEIHMSSPS